MLTIAEELRKEGKKEGESAADKETAKNVGRGRFDPLHHEVYGFD